MNQISPRETDIVDTARSASCATQSQDNFTEPLAKNLFTTVMYALTRPGVNGLTEFASIYGLWTTDMADAARYGHPAPIRYGLPDQMREAGAVTCQIVMSVYDTDLTKSQIRYSGGRVDNIVVAQRTNCHGQPVKDRVECVTSTGIIGRGYDILSSDHVARAVIMDPRRMTDADMVAIQEKTTRPFDQVGIWRYPRHYAFRPATRVTRIMSIGMIEDLG